MSRAQLSPTTSIAILFCCAAFVLVTSAAAETATETATETAAETAAEIVVLRGATLHPVSGPPIENGTLVLDGERIAALGESVEIPLGARIVELDAGQHVYPGFIAPLSVLGLTEISAVSATLDFEEVGEINSDLRAEVAVNAESRLLPVAISGGVLTAHVAMLGGTVSGRSAVISLDGWNWEDMTLENDIGLHLYYPAVLETDEEDEDDEESVSSSRAIAAVDEALDAARAYRKAKAAGARVPFDAKLEGLLPLLAGEMSLYLHAEEKNQVEAALDWAAEQGFDDVVLVTGPDAQYVAERLARDDVPVILEGVHRLPERRFEPYDMAFVAPRILHQAGVRFAISDGGGGFGAANVRNLPFQAATAAAHGLPKDVALHSVTLGAAEILGIDDRLGSLESGKDATFIVTDGDPLEISTHVERVWIGGQEIDLTRDPQYQLYEKYDNRPRREPEQAPE